MLRVVFEYLERPNMGIQSGSETVQAGRRAYGLLFVYTCRKRGKEVLEARPTNTIQAAGHDSLPHGLKE